LISVGVDFDSGVLTEDGSTTLTLVANNSTHGGCFHWVKIGKGRCCEAVLIESQGGEREREG
jgi:hypothetical protein